MATKYKQISDGRRAKIDNGALYVMQTNMCNGTLEDATRENDIGISDIDRCIEGGDVIRQGRLIR